MWNEYLTDAILQTTLFHDFLDFICYIYNLYSFRCADVKLVLIDFHLHSLKAFSMAFLRNSCCVKPTNLSLSLLSHSMMIVGKSLILYFETWLSFSSAFRYSNSTLLLKMFSNSFSMEI